MAKEPLGAKPWRPHPQQIRALVIASEGVPVTEIAARMELTPQAVGAILSAAYDRLGVKDVPGHRLSHTRRQAAVQVCRERGWWPISLGARPTAVETEES